MNPLTALGAIIQALLDRAKDEYYTNLLVKAKTMIAALKCAEDINTATIEKQYRDNQDLKHENKRLLTEIQRLNEQISAMRSED